MKKRSLTIGWLYPDLMSTYGDRGNIIVLSRRCQWRDIESRVLRIGIGTTTDELKRVDLIFGGGAQDREQAIVNRDLLKHKGKILKELVEQNTPALFVCGAPQLMGLYYEPAEGKRIDGVGIFDMVSIHPGKKVSRCIGNIVAQVHWRHLGVKTGKKTLIVGFENHGGRTYLGKKVRSFAKVIKGFGNNGKDATEGVVYKNAIGCYFHGPLLSKNPEIADWLITKALEVKYKEKTVLGKIDDSLSYEARKFMLKRLGVSYNS